MTNDYNPKAWFYLKRSDFSLNLTKVFKLLTLIGND